MPQNIFSVHVMLIGMMDILSHVKWFLEPVNDFLPPITAVEYIFITLFTIGGLALAYALQKIIKPYEVPINKFTSPYLRYVPTIVRLTGGLSLIIAAKNGYFLAPNLIEWPSFLIFLQFIVGVLWVLGIFSSPASVIFAGTFLLAIFSIPIVELIEHIEYLGIAGYMFIMGNGSLSMANIWKRYVLPEAARRYTALRVFMFFAGAALVWLALSEKLLNLSLAQTFLYTYEWNLLAGAGLSDRWFIIIMGTIELIIGLMIMLNILPRIAVLMVAGAMATTAMILGAEEVPGHLFVIGLFTAIWINDSNKIYKLKL